MVLKTTITKMILMIIFDLGNLFFKLNFLPRIEQSTNPINKITYIIGFKLVPPFVLNYYIIMLHKLLS